MPHFENEVLDKRPTITREMCIRIVRQNPVLVPCELQTDRKRVNHARPWGWMASLRNGRAIDSLVVIPRRLSWRL